jgi:hypothetical protein
MYTIMSARKYLGVFIHLEIILRCEVLSMWRSSSFTTNPFVGTTQMVSFVCGMLRYNPPVLM